MKKTQFRELLRLIGKTKVTFMAIALFTAMGLTLFLGLSWTVDGLLAATNDTFSRGRLADLEIRGALGIEETLVGEVEALEGVEAAEGYYEAYEFLRVNGQNHEVRLTTLTEKLNVPTRIEGRLPEKTGEIAIESTWAEDNHVAIGDTLTFFHDKEIAPDLTTALVNMSAAELVERFRPEGTEADPDGMKYLTQDTFTVTAVIDSPVYMTSVGNMYGVSVPDSIPVSTVMYVSDGSMDKNAFSGYTAVGVRGTDMGERDVFSDEYRQKADALIEKIRPTAEKHAKVLADRAQKKVDKLKTLPMIELPKAAEDLSRFACHFSSARDNRSAVSIEIVRTILSRLKFSMAGVFVLIGSLVCFFTVSRIVQESTKEIGTKKALGFNRREIAVFYMAYAVAAALAGGVLGAILAYALVEPIILGTMANNYRFYEVRYAFNVGSALLFVLVALVRQAATVWLACCRLLKKDAVTLLAGTEPPKAKTRFYEKTKLWKKLPLLGRTTVNNLFNEKGRVLSTLVGVTACCALVVCALTMNNHILDSFTRQYSKVFSYQVVLYVDPACEDTSHMEGVMDDLGLDYAQALASFMAIETPEGKQVPARILVTNAGDTEGFVCLNTDTGPVTPKNGIFVSRAYADYFSCTAGDTITVTDTLQTTYEKKVTAFFEHHLLYDLFMTDRVTYEKEFGTDYAPNAYLVKLNGCEFAKAEEALSGCDGFVYMNDEYSSEKVSFDAFAAVFRAVVASYLTLSTAMALLVLLNLFVMLVTEKKQELITLMINGYSLKAARKYIAVDTLVLTIIGLLLGLIVGTAMSAISLTAYRNESISFLSGPDLKACLAGLAMGGALSWLTCRLALRRISRFRLTDTSDK